MDGIGDALICTPLIVALRDAGHTLGIALSDRNADIFDDAPFFERYMLDRIPWPEHGSTPESSARAIAAIRAARYDVALIASEEPEAYALARGIARRVGFSTGLAKPFKSLWVRTQITHAVTRAADVGGERGHEAEIVFRLGATLHEERAPTRAVDRLRSFVRPQPVPDRTRAVMQLGMKWPAIGVPLERARELGAHLARGGARLIVGASEAARIGSLAGVEVVPSVSAWKAAIDEARVLITPDTGAAHVAGMLGVPTIDVFPEGNADAQISRWHPWAAPYRTLTADALVREGGIGALQALVDEF